MKKLIHSKFELDLTLLKITETESNSWFSDTFFSKISLPFEIDLTDDIDKAFDFISLYNTSPQTFYELKYCKDNFLCDATLEITEEQDGKLQCVYEFGIDEFPSWDKKLSELNLHKFDLAPGETIYQYAKAMINQTYPTADFCWPAIHDDVTDTTEEIWTSYRKIINNYQNQNFLENTVNVPTDTFENKNIMQPLPFWLYILKAGIEDAGYTLQGDVLADPVLQKKAVFAAVDYFKRRNPVSEFYYMYDTEFTSYLLITPPWYYQYAYIKDIIITKPGKYILSLKVTAHLLYDDQFNSLITVYVAATINGSVIGAADITSLDVGGGNLYYETEVEFTTQNTGSPNTLRLAVNTGPFQQPTQVFNVELINIIEFDDDYNPIPSIENENKIDLTKAVPDMTFGDFVKATKNWRNYDFYVEGKVVTMNQLQNELNYANADSVEAFEIKRPVRNFQQGLSFLLKFMDQDSKVFSWAKVFHNVNGYVQANYTTNTKTNTIEINALPLLRASKNGVNTSVMFEKVDTKLYAVLYDGLQNQKNTTLDPAPMLLPTVHIDCFEKWFNFRIKAIPFKWSFKALETEVSFLNIKKKIYGYKNFLLIRTLTRTQLTPNVIEIELETESLK